MEDLPKTCPKCGERYAASAAFCPRDGAPLSLPQADDPYLGQVLLGQFHIEQKIGAGGMGTVYRARQPAVDRHVAIKILHRELVQNPDAVRRFQREARVSAAIDHPHVVRVFLFGQLPDGNLYIVMEYLHGRSLLDLLQKEGRLIPSRAMHVLLQVCDGVGEAHSHGVVHRDVKPENVLLVTRGKDTDFAKVLDFGIARFVTGEQTVATQGGLIFGTARYISPEGAAGEPTDARSDVYSLAVMGYQLLCGETPFDSPSPVALLMKHMNEQAPDIRTRQNGGHIPAPVAQALARALAKSPDTRYSDAHVFADALRDASARGGIVIPEIRRQSSLPQASAPQSGSITVGGAPQPKQAVVNPAVQGSGTLAAAPNPFHEHTQGGIARLAAPRSARTLIVVGLCFVVGFALVVGGYFVVRKNAERDQVAVLETRARGALARKAFDTPANENVDALTKALLARDPQSAAARTIRTQAARELNSAGAAARARNLFAEAKHDYERALVFAPRNATAEEGLREVERALHSTREPAQTASTVRTLPSQPLAGQPITLLAELAPETHVDPTANPHFRVTQNGRAIQGEINGSSALNGRAYIATFVFPRPGQYALTFVQHARGASLSLDLRGTVKVIPDPNARPSTPDRRPRPDVPVTTHDFRRDPVTPLVLPPADDNNVNWQVAPVTRPPDPLTPNPTPAPSPNPTTLPPAWNG